MINHLGYNKPLFILPFDHRSSFAKMFNADPDQITQLKQIIYEGFKDAVSKSIPKENAAILVDEKYGDAILRDAKKEGFTILLSVEKSGIKEFEFEYGNDFKTHIKKYKPTFAKALIRYSPKDDLEKNKRLQEKLKILSDWCHENGYKFLLEVLMEPTQTSSQLLLESIKQLQNVGVEPDVWKIEGMENAEDYRLTVQQARRNGRNNIGVVVLGRGENKEMVEKWIKAGASVDGICGFAIGRTIFADPLKSYINNVINRETVIEKISNNFKYFYNLFQNNK